jgi:hypothetical protein
LATVKLKEVSFTNLMLPILKGKCLKKSKKLSRESLKLRELKKMLSRRGLMRNLMRMRGQRLKESASLLKKRKSARSVRRKEPKVPRQRRKRRRSRDPSLPPSEWLPRNPESPILTVTSSLLF